MLTVLLAVRRPPAPHWVGEMLRLADFMQPWSMNEVMMLGILVALIKIAELATVNAGIGMYAVGALVLLFPAIMVTFDPRKSGSGSMGGRERRDHPDEVPAQSEHKIKIIHHRDAEFTEIGVLCALSACGEFYSWPIWNQNL